MTNKGKQNQTPSTESVNKEMGDFNFDQWAKQVRPQLLASLQKRGIR